MLSGCDKLLVINPRRNAFDLTDPSVSVDQIKWEHRALQEADLVSFWFPHETLCPITLLELGVQITRRKHNSSTLLVGCSPKKT